MSKFFGKKKSKILDLSFFKFRLCVGYICSSALRYITQSIPYTSIILYKCTSIESKGLYYEQTKITGTILKILSLV